MFEGWGAAIAVTAAGAAVGSAVSSSNASKAANAQTQAAQTASDTQLQMYNQTRTDQAPWRTAGAGAVGALNSWYGLPTTTQNADGTYSSTAANPNAGAADMKTLQSLPGYQFNLQQGNQAVQRNLSAQGLLQSGAAGKALTQYGQGYAQNSANSYLNGLQSLSGLGQTSAAQTGMIGANAANQIGSNQIYAGNAQASGYANQSNAINQGLSGLTGAFNQYGSQQNALYGQNGAYSAGLNMGSPGNMANYNSQLNDWYNSATANVVGNP
jgi:hypothetical protein